jgi:hypothetical protein
VDDSNEGRQGSGLRYRLVVEGRLGPEWRDWFGAAAVEVDEERTVIELRVRDQAELHGLLRRVHDLHLPLVSLTRLASREYNRARPARRPWMPSCSPPDPNGTNDE